MNTIFPVSEAKLNDLQTRMEKLGIKEEDLEEEFIRGSGAGGQKVNKTSVVVRLTHLPSGTQVRCHHGRSQAMNRFMARRLLVEKIEEEKEGAAALLLGGVRPTQDIDFNITTKADWDILSQAIIESEEQTQIRAEYSENIDRWSMISLLNFKQHTRAYKKFGRINVKILEPEYWSIGKITRYYDSDIHDMIEVFKHQKTSAKKLIQIWKKAIKSSPRSTAQIHFKKQAEHFLKEYGPEIWGEELEIKWT